jgi:hypothetical protein
MGFQPFNPTVQGFANPMTTAGDLIDGGTAGAAQRLALGSTGQVLTVSGGAPTWSASSPAVPVSIANGGTGQTSAGAAFNALNPNAAPAGFAPANPTPTSTTSLVMMGMGSTVSYTPAGSGTLLVVVSGYGQSVTGATAITIGPRYGTGTAPLGVISPTVSSGTGGYALLTATNSYAAGQAVYVGGTTQPGNFTQGTTYYVSTNPTYAPTSSAFYLSTSNSTSASPVTYSSAGAGVNTGSVVTGTRFGYSTDLVLRGPSSAGDNPGGFGVTGVITGLAAGTPCWFDLAVSTFTAADVGQLYTVMFSIVELPAG